ncbi:hypothetical protein CPC16_004620 [Podila verticillata]|nr:hypothetical protein CPC16_004620 [Podila verticillata]
MSTNLDSSSPHPCISSDEVLKSIARELETAGISNSTHQASTFRNQRFLLQSFLTIPERASYLFPRSKNYRSIHVQERLILIAAETTDHNNVLIAGVEVLEYTLTPHTSDNQAIVPERFVYIAKIDTSGNWHIPGSESQMKKSPVRALVHGYLNAMRCHKIKVSISSAPSSTECTQQLSTCTPKTSLYVFARAQPQYLFAQSIKNRGKHILNDRGLIRWWKNMVGSAYFKQGDDSNNSSTKRPIQASWHIPGCESERHAAVITQTGTDDADMWTYGHHYKGSKGLSRDIIPQFPDDPKSRMIQSDTSGRGAADVNTFWELMAISEECGAGRMTGFFRVVEEGTPLEPSTEAVAEREEEEQVSMDSDVTVVEEETTLEPPTEVEVIEEDVSESEPDYTDMINVLLNLDFASLETSIESTQRWQGYVNKWRNMAKTCDSLRIQEHEVDVQVAVKSDAHVASSPATAPATPVNFLGAGMIKRKATTSSPATAAPVNVLGAGMIKRKVTTSSPVTPAATAAIGINVLDAGLIKGKETASPPVNFLGASLIKRKQPTAPPSIIEEAKRPKLDDTK